MAICVEVPVLVHFLESLDLVILGALEVRVLERLAEGPDVGAEGGQLQSVHHSAHRDGDLGPSLGSVARKASIALCCGVAGNPGGDLGDCGAAGGAAEARGGVRGVGVDGAELVVAELSQPTRSIFSLLI